MSLKIYGTLGPSCCSKQTIEEMLKAGMTGMRLNLSHCNLIEKTSWIDAFHDACHSLRIKADFMIDMRGPELRTLDFGYALMLQSGTSVTLNQTILPTQVLCGVQKEDVIFIDDGKLKLHVVKQTENELTCYVQHGGLLYPRKSIFIQGKHLKGPILTESDLINLKYATSYGVTAIMQPFVSSAEDLIQLKEAMKSVYADKLKIYAKIENMEGVRHLDEIKQHCDCIVIARGDLANACGLTSLPVIQKKIEKSCKDSSTPYMVVTEMLHSMIESPTPTRAEVSDVFHAIYHGASSIMLTGETANGRYPIEAMNTFTQVAKQALAYKEKENNHD